METFAFAGKSAQQIQNWTKDTSLRDFWFDYTDLWYDTMLFDKKIYLAKITFE